MGEFANVWIGCMAPSSSGFLEFGGGLPQRAAPGVRSRAGAASLLPAADALSRALEGGGEGAVRLRAAPRCNHAPAVRVLDDEPTPCSEPAPRAVLADALVRLPVESGSSTVEPGVDLGLHRPGLRFAFERRFGPDPRFDK
jgi:hypothetical protein